MLSPREATEAPRQWSRSPFSPTEVTESATVLVFLILSALLCSVNNADLKTATWLLYCLRLRSRSPHNAQHSTSIYIYIYIRVVRRALNLLRASFSPIFQYFSVVNVTRTRVSFSPILVLQYFNISYITCMPWIRQPIDIVYPATEDCY